GGEGCERWGGRRGGGGGREGGGMSATQNARPGSSPASRNERRRQGPPNKTPVAGGRESAPAGVSDPESCICPVPSPRRPAWRAEALSSRALPQNRAEEPPSRAAACRPPPATETRSSS